LGCSEEAEKQGRYSVILFLCKHGNGITRAASAVFVFVKFQFVSGQRRRRRRRRGLVGIRDSMKVHD
jgi:hypothetical protein